MNNALIKLFCLSLLMTLSLLSFSTTAVTLSNLFQDNMIIQRDKPFLISGSAAPSTPVTIILDKSEWKAMSNLQGYWEVNLPAQAVGGPHVIKVTSQKKEKEISNIYFGDVWIASGQSNMEWKLSWSTDNWEDESLQANLPLIRFLEVKNTISPTPKSTLTLEKKWLSATPDTVKDFSAIAWYFAKAIHLDTDVPIGIIDSAWGGTPIEAWTPNSIIKNLPNEYPNPTYLDKDDWQNKVQLSDNNNKRKQQQLHNEKAFKELQIASEQYDDSTWQLTSLPGEYQGDNIVWMRKKIYLSNISIKEPSLLSFGLYPNYFEVFINNKRIFKRAAHQPLGTITIPAGTLKNGDNTIAIRTANDWSNFKRFGLKEQLYIINGQQKINLTGDWRTNNTLEEPLVSGTRYQGSHSVLYNAMIHPLINFNIKGVIWYQGESNTSRADLYQAQFKNLITSWRNKWQQPKLPFYYVQLANYKERIDYPKESGWAQIRNAQLNTLALSNTGMAVTIDVGNSLDVHPRNKKVVGNRLASIAKTKTYGGNKSYSGPIISTIRQEKNSLIANFSHTDNHLTSHHNLTLYNDSQNSLFTKAQSELLGFEIAGTDGIYHNIDAEVHNNSVILSPVNIGKVCSVRYAWADNPIASLFNSEGFPASPFEYVMTDKCLK